jgi:hypothetical protein
MKSYNLGIIEIAAENIGITRGLFVNANVNFYEAEELIEKLGGGWRLPTMKEALFLQEYSDLNVLNLNDGAYWISEGLESDEDIGEYTGWAYYFSLKRRGGIPKTERNNVRLVRSI